MKEIGVSVITAILTTLIINYLIALLYGSYRQLRIDIIEAYVVYSNCFFNRNPNAVDEGRLKFRQLAARAESLSGHFILSIIVSREKLQTVSQELIGMSNVIVRNEAGSQEMYNIIYDKIKNIINLDKFF